MTTHCCSCDGCVRPKGTNKIVNSAVLNIMALWLYYHCCVEKWACGWDFDGITDTPPEAWRLRSMACLHTCKRPRECTHVHTLAHHSPASSRMHNMTARDRCACQELSY